MSVRVILLHSISVMSIKGVSYILLKKKKLIFTGCFRRKNNLNIKFKTLEIKNKTKVWLKFDDNFVLLFEI